MKLPFRTRRLLPGFGLLLGDDEGVEAASHVRHVSAAGPSARLQLRLASGQFLDAEISRAQLESMALDEGDEVGLRIRTSRHFARESVAAR